MKKLLFTGVLSLMALSCEKKQTPKNIPVSEDASKISETSPDTLAIKSFCFMKISASDTVAASFDDNLGTLSGKMVFKNHEKDSSVGDISGFKVGDTLKLTYEFSSEGKISKRDIYFLQKDNSLFMGIGDQKDNAGQMIYADEKKISYPEDQKLEPADCGKVSDLLR